MHTRSDEVRDVRITPECEGFLGLPWEEPRGVVLFAHASGSSRLGPRNTAVAARLRAAGFATLLFDLLTGKEERSRARVSDIPLLTRRLSQATDFVSGQAELAHVPVGYFGFGTGAAAALVAAADHGSRVAAVVSRGGLLDLAGAAIERVRAPTLLLAGSYDYEMLEMNRAVQARMHCPTRLALISGTGHLFDEPGTMQEAVALTLGWFMRHMPLPEEE